MILEVLPVDLSSTTAIALGIPLVVVIISYIVYRIGIAEKSFEEVIEEQKRRSIEEELKQKSEKVKKEKKFKKTWGKKTKEKDAEVSPEPVPVVETKDVETEIEIIEPKEVKPAKVKVKSKSAASSQQSIDVNAQEKVRKVDPSPVNEKPVQERKKAVVTEVTKTEAKPVEIPKQVEVKETVHQSSASPVQTVNMANNMVTSQKKKKKEQVEKDATPITASKLLHFIKESDLEAEEIQNLIEVLLNKQKDTSGWTKKNDPLALTKKNLQEKEQLLDQELRQNQAVTSKLKDLREEHNALKAKLTAQEKASAEKISRLQQDVQNLTVRSKQLQEQLTSEKEKLVQIEKENEKKIQASVKSLEEEKAKLLQKISKLETESRSGISKTDYDTLKKSREELQKVHMLLVDQHTQLVSKDKNHQAQLNDLRNQVEKLNIQNKALADECKTLKDSQASGVEVAKKTLEDKLKAEQRRSADLETQVKELCAQVADLAELQSQLNKVKAELQEAKSDLKEAQRFSEQLVTSKDRVAGDGQEVLHQNGELNGEPQGISMNAEEKDKILEEKEHLLVQLKEDLNKQKAKIALLSEEIEVQKQKNNELREKNWKAVEALKEAEKSAEQRIKEIQVAADQKVAQLEKSVTSQCSQKSEVPPEVTERLKKAENEAAQRLSDYNKELDKNKQLSAEILKLNELHKSSIDELHNKLEGLKSSLESCQLQTKECLHRLCPSVLVNSSLPYEKWLLEYEQQAATVIRSAESQSTESPERLEKLLEEKEKEFLEKQQHYEKALADTSSTLLELQNTAESQEVIWKGKLTAKDLELQKIISERDALIAEKEAMESAFQQISQLEELQEKLKLLQSTLENAESERSHIESKYEEVQKNYLNLRDQLENKEKQIVELQQQSNSLENLNKEIEDLKSKLDKEKKISKDFSSQMIRLNSLVKIGQDALKEEQEMVKKLKAQLETAQVSTTNGTASNAVQSPIAVEESRSKTKNPEKSKKKMDVSGKK